MTWHVNWRAQYGCAETTQTSLINTDSDTDEDSTVEPLQTMDNDTNGDKIQIVTPMKCLQLSHFRPWIVTLMVIKYG